MIQSASAADSIIIKVLEGDGAINNIRTQRAKEPVVRVETENGTPIAGVVVHFVAPAAGPGGHFLDGGSNLTTLTDHEGRASGPGFRPNKSAGQFHIRVTASFSGQTTNARIVQTNAESAVATAGSSKKIAILAILGGAVAGGAALAARSGGKNTPAAAAPSGTVITSGSPSFGAP
ncbi:MAG: hypothetical protein ABIZ80_11435 [Bryobacteraceae bacterium]